MKVAQLRKVFEAAEQIYRGGGNASAAQSLNQLSSLCTGYETMTVSRFATLISKTTAGDKRGL